MFGFFTVVLFVYFVATFKSDRSKLFTDISDVAKKKKADGDVSDDEVIGALLKSLGVLGLVLISLIQAIYLLNALKVDVYFYPTVAMTVLILFNYIKEKVKSNSRKKIQSIMTEEMKVEYSIKCIEEDSVNYHKFGNVVFRYFARTSSVVYYTYMMWIVFIR